MSDKLFIHRFVPNEKYGGGNVRVDTAPLKFKDCFTEGIKRSKFDNNKFTIGIKLNPDQLKTFNNFIKQVQIHMLEVVEEVDRISTCVYGNTVYLKLQPVVSYICNEKAEQLRLTEMLEHRNLVVDAEVVLTGVHVNKKNISFLQLKLGKLTILNKNNIKTATI